MKRREVFGLLIGAVALPVYTWAQEAQTIKSIGVIMTGSPDTHAQYLLAFRDRLRELGRIEGTNISLQVDWAYGRVNTLPLIASRLMTLKPELIIAPTTTAVTAVRAADPNIAIVFLTVADPIQSGFAATYGRPGGKMTGIRGNVETLPGKQIALVREVLPMINRIGMLVNTGDPSTLEQARNAEEAANATKIELLRAEVSEPADFEPAFRKLRSLDVKFVIVPTDAMLSTERQTLGVQATSSLLPLIAPYREQAQAGALISYGVNLVDSYRRAADYAVKILSGVPPGEIPIEFPAKLSLVLNLQIARILNISFPTSLLVRADEVIE
jgi:putative ABC transport system substrate-binding protein